MRAIPAVAVPVIGCGARAYNLARICKGRGNLRRYAIYHLPGGDLGAFGNHWLGWDARRGCAVAPAPDLPGRAEAVSTPCRYGFHATLKAPFALAPGRSPQALARALRDICAHLPAVDLALTLSCDWGFVALRPTQTPPDLRRIEAALVTGLDGFRAPLDDHDRQRRRPQTLPARARAHLERWGYPFVLDLFQYHLTLSGALEPGPASALAAGLAPHLEPLLARPLALDRVALMGEDAQGRFHMIEEVPLTG